MMRLRISDAPLPGTVQWISTTTSLKEIREKVQRRYFVVKIDLRRSIHHLGDLFKQYIVV